MLAYWDVGCWDVCIPSDGAFVCPRGVMHPFLVHLDLNSVQVDMWSGGPPPQSLNTPDLRWSGGLRFGLGDLETSMVFEVWCSRHARLTHP